MKRTQLYLDENVWKALHIRSWQQGVSISELVRRAVSDKYGKSPKDRQKAMQALVGLRKNRPDLDSTAHIRRLRKGKRLTRLSS
jgi:hypothetical protein